MPEQTNEGEAPIVARAREQAEQLTACAQRQVRVQQQLLQLNAEAFALTEQLRKVVGETQVLIEKASRLTTALQVISETASE